MSACGLDNIEPCLVENIRHKQVDEHPIVHHQCLAAVVPGTIAGQRRTAEGIPV